MRQNPGRDRSFETQILLHRAHGEIGFLDLRLGFRAGTVHNGTPLEERDVSENLDLFRRMRAGEFEDGARTFIASRVIAEQTARTMACQLGGIRSPSVLRSSKLRAWSLPGFPSPLR